MVAGPVLGLVAGLARSIALHAAQLGGCGIEHQLAVTLDDGEAFDGALVSGQLLRRDDESQLTAAVARGGRGHRLLGLIGGVDRDVLEAGIRDGFLELDSLAGDQSDGQHRDSRNEYCDHDQCEKSLGPDALGLVLGLALACGFHIWPEDVVLQSRHVLVLSLAWGRGS